MKLVSRDGTSQFVTLLDRNSRLFMVRLLDRKKITESAVTRMTGQLKSMFTTKVKLILCVTGNVSRSARSCKRGEHEEQECQNFLTIGLFMKSKPSTLPSQTERLRD